MSEIPTPDPIAEAAVPADAGVPVEAAVPAVNPVVGEMDPRTLERKLIEGRVIETLQTVFDPEIPVNIYELGLIYAIDVKDDNSVQVRMTLTAPACPVAGTLPGEVEKKIEAIPEVKSANVELVWDPPWSREMMSESAQLTLGLM